MIVQLLAGVLAVFGLTLLLRSLWLRSGLSRRQTWVTAGAALVIITLIALAAMGRLHWIVAAGAALVPILRRSLGLLRLAPLFNQIFPGWHQRFRGAGNSGSNSGASSDYATTDTPNLRMSLHHASGHMDGEVLTGPHRGQLLSELSQTDVINLYSTFADQDSRRLLETYLDRTWPDWRTQQTAQPGSGDLDRAHALEVLGLEANATRDDIVDAHRRLIQKLHPDRGGSTYLAATLNEAKRVLLAD